MANPTAADVLGTTTLITGSNEFLAERTIATIRSTIHSADADADLSELPAEELGAGALAEISSPSLFASLRCVVVRALENLPESAVDSLVAFVAEPAPDVALVLHHTGGVKGKAVLDMVRTAGATEIKALPLKKWELPAWVDAEFRRHRARVSEPVASALVDAVGEDLRALAGAAGQLASDAQGEPITDELVKKYFGGRAEVTGFAVADAAVEGRGADALEQLRWAFAVKVDPVLITSAVAGGLRGLARYMFAPRGLREADLARDVGVPAWKLKSLAAQSRGWSGRGLASAIQAAARADADVKGASGDRQWACERLVISVIRARSLH
ncbi:MAG: DNA polymerase III subunit delta [Propionibacteriales bacterium]|nr:DNA polymerase III subunit delta [Propionibacteriales bacterium]